MISEAFLKELKKHTDGYFRMNVRAIARFRSGQFKILYQGIGPGGHSMQQAPHLN